MAEQLTLIARLSARPEHAEAVAAALEAMVEKTRAEAGSIDYHVHRGSDDPNLFVLYENWRSRADLEAHFAAPYTAALFARLPEMLADEMQLTYATMTSPRPAR